MMSKVGTKLSRMRHLKFLSMKLTHKKKTSSTRCHTYGQRCRISSTSRKSSTNHRHVREGIVFQYWIFAECATITTEILLAIKEYSYALMNIIISWIPYASLLSVNYRYLSDQNSMYCRMIKMYLIRL